MMMDDTRGDRREEVDDDCPRCGMKGLRAWRDLSEEEQEVVRRLPAAADHSLPERAAWCRWCPRCWHEVSSNEPRYA